MAPRARAPLRISCTFTRPEGAPGRAKRPLVQPHLTRTGASHTYRRISHIRGRCILALLARAPRRRGRSAGRVPRILTSLGPLTAAYAHLSLRASRVPLRRKLPLGLAVGPVGVIDQLVERLAGVGARLRPSGHAPWSTRGGAPRLRAGACARGRRGSTRRCRAARGAGGANHSAPPHPPLLLFPLPRVLGGGGANHSAARNRAAEGRAAGARLLRDVGAAPEERNGHGGISAVAEGGVDAEHHYRHRIQVVLRAEIK